MSAAEDRFEVEIEGIRVQVIGPEDKRWVLWVDGREVDTAEAIGNVTLRGPLPDGSDVSAEIREPVLEPRTVCVLRDGQEFARFQDLRPAATR